MLWIVEIALTIWAWNKGWKWRSLIPLGIGIGIAFIAGLSVGASGGSVSDLGWLVVVDVIVCIVLAIMCFAPPKNEEETKLEEKKPE